MLRSATKSFAAAAKPRAAAPSSLPMLRRTLSTSPLIRGPWSDSTPSSSSSSAPRQLNHYVILAEDVEEGGEGLRRRLQVRPEHLAGAREGKECGRIELGGGLLGVDHSEIGGDGPAQHLKGSLFVVLGESITEVRSRLEQDVYYSSGVFDPAKVRIFPFLKASLGDSSATSVSAATSAGAAAGAAASASSSEDGATTTTTTTVRPSLSKLREEEMSRWAEKAAKSLQWLRDGGGKQGLA